jgi:hypothetical protein
MVNTTPARVLVGAVALSIVSAARAQTPDAIEAPVHKVGDTWTWVAKMGGSDRCTDAFGNGARTSQTVTEVASSGYVAEVLGPSAGATARRTYALDLSSAIQVQGETYKTDVLNFPIRPGNKWDTKLLNGNVFTTLSCEAGAFERIDAAKQIVMAAPITCKGKWKNLQSGNGDSATYRYWYSPDVGNLVRRSVFTYLRGATCSEFEFNLESFRQQGN